MVQDRCETESEFRWKLYSQAYQPEWKRLVRAPSTFLVPQSPLKPGDATNPVLSRPFSPANYRSYQIASSFVWPVILSFVAWVFQIDSTSKTKFLETAGHASGPRAENLTPVKRDVLAPLVKSQSNVAAALPNLRFVTRSIPDRITCLCQAGHPLRPGILHDQRVELSSEIGLQLRTRTSQ